MSSVYLWSRLATKVHGLLETSVHAGKVNGQGGIRSSKFHHVPPTPTGQWIHRDPNGSDVVPAIPKPPIETCLRSISAAAIRPSACQTFRSQLHSMWWLPLRWFVNHVDLHVPSFSNFYFYLYFKVIDFIWFRCSQCSGCHDLPGDWARCHEGKCWESAAAWLPIEEIGEMFEIIIDWGRFLVCSMFVICATLRSPQSQPWHPFQCCPYHADDGWGHRIDPMEAKNTEQQSPVQQIWSLIYNIIQCISTCNHYYKIVQVQLHKVCLHLKRNVSWFGSNSRQ